MGETGKTCEELLERWRQGGASVEEIRALPRDLGRDHCASGIPVLVELLDHPDEIVRENAGTSLAFDFRYVPATDKLLRMLVSDWDADCRDVAASGLGSLYRDTKDGRVLAALAEAALADSDEYVRSAAYKALLRVHGMSRDEYIESLGDRSLVVEVDRVRAIQSEMSTQNERRG